MKNELKLWLKATCIFVPISLLILGFILITAKYPIMLLITLIILASFCIISLIKEELN